MLGVKWCELTPLYVPVEVVVTSLTCEEEEVAGPGLSLNDTSMHSVLISNQTSGSLVWRKITPSRAVLKCQRVIVNNSLTVYLWCVAAFR